MYTNDDENKLYDTISKVSELVEGVKHLDLSMTDGVDQTTMAVIDTMMCKIYNTTHEYMMYREQREVKA